MKKKRFFLIEEIKEQAIVTMNTEEATAVYSGHFFVFPELTPRSGKHFAIDDETHEDLIDILYPFASGGDEEGTRELFVSDDLQSEKSETNFTVGVNGDFPRFGFIPTESDSAELTSARKTFQPKLEVLFQKYNVPYDLETAKFGKYFWVR